MWHSEAMQAIWSFDGMVDGSMNSKIQENCFIQTTHVGEKSPLLQTGRRDTTQAACSAQLPRSRRECITNHTSAPENGCSPRHSFFDANPQK